MNRCLLTGLAFAAGLLFANPGPADELKIAPPREIAGADNVAQPQGAFGDGVYLIVWRRGWPGFGATADVVGRRFEARTLRPVDAEPIVICAADEAQDAPSVAFHGGKFLVAWQDLRNGADHDVRGLLIDAKTGRKVGGEISVAAGPGNQVHPAVAPTDDGFLVAWQDWRGEGRYGISARHVADDGELGNAPLTVSDYGARPAICRSGSRILICWTTGDYRGRTEAALVNVGSGQLKRHGAINTACPDGVAVAGDGAGAFMTVAARAPYPDPWGWGGPGAVVCSRILADGTTPDAGRDYGYRMTRLSERTVPNVVDAASWGKNPKSKWDAGAPGGFPGTPDGLWPRGLPAVAHAGDGCFLFAWVKGRIGSDRLTVSQYDIWMRGLNGRTLEEQVQLQQVAAGKDVDETRPSLLAGPDGECLLLHEGVSPSGRRILARLITRNVKKQ